MSGHVGRDLRVRYLLLGTIQRVGDRVRITAQLVDTTNGRQLWSDRFDRQGKDLFAIQDDIIETVVARLAIQVLFGREDTNSRGSDEKHGRL